MYSHVLSYGEPLWTAVAAAVGAALWNPHVQARQADGPTLAAAHGTALGAAHAHACKTHGTAEQAAHGTTVEAPNWGAIGATHQSHGAAK